MLLACVGSARADGAGEPDEVVVLGTSSASGFVSKASVDDAPREVTDATSLIESVPGVHVRRLGGDDGFATLSIRGSSSSEVAILFAGVPMTGAADPSLDLSTLPLWPGARIRVYRSFAPAAVGSGSLGGTLVLEPPRPSDPLRTETWAAVGSFGGARMRAADVRAIGDGGARLVTALSASRADDDFSYYDPTHQDVTTRQNNGHAAVNGLVALALPAGSGGTLTVTTLLQARDQHLPGSIEYPTPFTDLTSNRELASVELSLPAGVGAWSARAWGRRDELHIEDKACCSEGGPTRSDAAIVGVGGSGGWRGQVATGLTLEARGDANAEGYEPGVYVGPGGPPPNATRVSAGAGLDADWRATAAWRVGASGRIDTNTDRVDQDSGVVAPTLAGGTRATGHLGSELEMGPAVLAAHGGALARPPSFVELYGNRSGVLSNPSLVGESAWTADAGVRAASPRGRVRARAELASFATWARDLILFVPIGFTRQLQATNIGRARIYGVEASVGAWGYGFDVRAAYTGLLTFNDACACAGSPPLPGRPAHDVVADLGYTLGPARVRYGIDAVAGMSADLVGDIPVPPRILSSTGVRIDVPGVRGLRVSAEVRNLFDVRTVAYAGIAGPYVLPIGDQYDYPLPGRSFLVTARWTSAPEVIPERESRSQKDGKTEGGEF
jgi:hypothetical protein